MADNNKKVHLNHKAYSSDMSVIEHSKEILAENLTICEDWSLSVDLKLPNRSTTEWRSIFSLYVDKNNSINTGQLDQRMLAVSIRPDQSNVIVVITYDIGTNLKYMYNTTKKVNEGNWISLKISQTGGLYEIKVDYELVYHKDKFLPKPWTNVKLVSGVSHDKKNIPTIVHYRDFNIKTYKTKGKRTN